jgi:hypothetical protein
VRLTQLAKSNHSTYKEFLDRLRRTNDPGDPEKESLRSSLQEDQLQRCRVTQQLPAFEQDHSAGLPKMGKELLGE